MFLKIGGRVRPFNEADASISYTPIFDGQRRIVKVHQVWQIDGNVNLQTNASQTRMTQSLRILEQDFSQYRPDLVFLEDNGSTPSALQLLASNCLQGPELTNFSYPKNPNKVYATGHPYVATMEADVIGAATGNAILQFSEQVVSEGTGGWERVHVGGAINLPEEQIGTQYNPYVYRQSGFAVGLFGYPTIPPPLWPSKLKRPNPQVVDVSPEIIGPIDQHFRRSWTYIFESAYPLTGYPHRTTY
jgi:hypothetical protein